MTAHDGFGDPQSVTASLQCVLTILTAKATLEEAQEFKYFVYRVADKTAKAAKEKGGELVSAKEQTALQQVAALLEYQA